MGSRVSRRAFGHFGGSGTFVRVDPEAGVACAVLTERESVSGRKQRGRLFRMPFSTN
jgi:CubicO group peptidase (beta-lactamase class C family)